MARMLADAHRGRVCGYGCCVEFRRDFSWRGLRGKMRAREKAAWRRVEL